MPQIRTITRTESGGSMAEDRARRIVGIRTMYD